MIKTHKQQIMALDAQIRQLKNQVARAEFIAQNADRRVAILQKLIDISEEEYKMDIRKNLTSEQLKAFWEKKS